MTAAAIINLLLIAFSDWQREVFASLCQFT